MQQQRLWQSPARNMFTPAYLPSLFLSISQCHESLHTRAIFRPKCIPTPPPPIFEVKIRAGKTVIGFEPRHGQASVASGSCTSACSAAPAARRDSTSAVTFFRSACDDEKASRNTQHGEYGAVGVKIPYKKDIHLALALVFPPMVIDNKTSQPYDIRTSERTRNDDNKLSYI